MTSETIANVPIAASEIQKPLAPESNSGALKFMPSTPATTASVPSNTVTKVSTRMVSLVRCALRLV